MVGGSGRIAVCVPPEFDYLPGLFAPERGRAAVVAAHAEELVDVVASAGRTASETARGLRDDGVRTVRVVGGPFEVRGAACLEGALLAADLAVELALDPEAGRWDPPVGSCVRAPSDLARAEGATVLVLPTEVPRGDARARLLDLGRALVERVGAQRVRIDHERSLRAPMGRAGGAPWAARYGVDDGAWRDLLEELVESVLPLRAGLWHSVVGYWRLGVDPLEEMYAGNSIVERNAELLENIVP